MKVVIALKQHVGAPCESIVSQGDKVKRGQLIATPNGLGANIHSSIDGKIVEVNGFNIVIEGEVSDHYVELTSQDPLSLIEEAGVVGAGGAGFPTHIKLKTPIKGGVVIANAAECEPVLAHNIELLETDPACVVKGLAIAMKLVEAEKGYIAIKTKHLKAIKSISNEIKKYENISIKILPDMYPAGDERVIIRELLGIELEPGQLPSIANAVISNVETLKRIYEAVELKKPFIDKDFTVSGRIHHEDGLRVYLDEPIGRVVKDYIDDCGGYIFPHGEIVLGGPFTGRHGEEDSPLTKTLGGILVSMPFPEEHSKVGLLVCECGAGEERLRAIAEGMGAEVVAVERCKRMVEVNGRERCEKPGVCPGQAQKVLGMKKKGMQAIIAGSCGD